MTTQDKGTVEAKPVTLPAETVKQYNEQFEQLKAARKTN